MKKPITIAGILLILCGAAGGIFYWKTKIKGAVVSPIDQQSNTSSQSATLLIWDDPAGFKFQYPKGLSVNKHDEDQENYAHVELMNPNHPGSVIVWAKDTTAADAAAWAKTEKAFTGASILDTTLGNQPAKKILLTAPNRTVIVGTIYDELLFTVEATMGNDTYWSEVAQTAIDSFTFTPIPAEQGSAEEGGAPGGSEAVDEEEVIE